ncbi:VOC family protein [Arthrobacter sp. GCM10027362]|uniref:VOC family protein n=1 Tax=Arthrobacter sp. GCM10027362 TaxID=3273379 RepID=UPI00363C9613
MARMIFPNLPVSDVGKATAFYTGLGFAKDPRFSNEQCSAITVADNITVMLLEKGMYEGFLGEGGTAHLNSSAKEVLNCLSCDSREEVDDLVARAEAAGGSVYLPPQEQMPGMYGASIADPDGHVWELLWMSPEAVEAVGEQNAGQA